MDKKRVYTFGNGQAEGKADMRTVSYTHLRTVPFFEEAGAVAHIGSYGFGQRWRILLV